MFGTIVLLGIGFYLGLVGSNSDKLSGLGKSGYDFIVKTKDSITNKKVD